MIEQSEKFDVGIWSSQNKENTVSMVESFFAKTG